MFIYSSPLMALEGKSFLSPWSSASDTAEGVQHFQLGQGTTYDDILGLNAFILWIDTALKDMPMGTFWQICLAGGSLLLHETTVLFPFTSFIQVIMNIIINVILNF
ncbi:hypothetical protein M758_7G131600 [Ceratodon purpureus]|nr:hypothetical protein M758_7G131600 [Ceratodon purpureus]